MSVNAKKLVLFALLIITSTVSFAAENHYLRYNKATNTFDEVSGPVTSYDKTTNTVQTTTTTTSVTNRAAPVAYSSVPQQVVPSQQTRNIPTAAPITPNYAAPLANQP